MAGANRTQQQEHIVVKIDQVDLANRQAHVTDKTDSPFVVSFRSAPGGVFHVPTQGEKWTAKRLGATWHLDQRLDSLDEHTWAVANMGDGDTRIEGTRVFVNHRPFGPTIVETFLSDPAAFTAVTLAHTPTGAGQVSVYLNGLLAQESLWTLSGKTITFIPAMAAGYVNVEYQTDEAP